MRSPICTPADSAGLPGIKLLTQARLIGSNGNAPLHSHATVNHPEGIRFPDTTILPSTTGAPFAAGGSGDLAAADVHSTADTGSKRSQARDLIPNFLSRDTRMR